MTEPEWLKTAEYRWHSKSRGREEEEEAEVEEAAEAGEGKEEEEEKFPKPTFSIRVEIHTPSLVSSFHTGHGRDAPGVAQWVHQRIPNWGDTHLGSQRRKPIKVEHQQLEWRMIDSTLGILSHVRGAENHMGNQAVGVPTDTFTAHCQLRWWRSNVGVSTRCMNKVGP